MKFDIGNEVNSCFTSSVFGEKNSNFIWHIFNSFHLTRPKALQSYAALHTGLLNLLSAIINSNLNKAYQQYCIKIFETEGITKEKRRNKTIFVFSKAAIDSVKEMKIKIKMLKPYIVYYLTP